MNNDSQDNLILQEIRFIIDLLLNTMTNTNNIKLRSERWARYLKRQGAWLWAGRLGFDPGYRRGGDFSALLRVQTGTGVHLASYKMSTGCFPRE